MLRHFFIVAALAIAIRVLASDAFAGPPSYLLLRQTQSASPVHQVSTGPPHEVHAQGYAYGYFGAAPRTHSQRHYGYYRNYTQWSSW